MSEPCSFFLKARISKAQLQQFLRAAPTQPALDDNWRAWWDSREMYGKGELNDTYMRAYTDASNQAIVDGWLNAEGTFAFSDYDEQSEIWHFGIIMCSENYLDLIPQLAFTQSILPYKSFAEDDFALVYPFVWGDGYVMAYMQFAQDAALLAPAISATEQVPSAHLAYAAAYLTKKFAEFAEKGETEAD